MLEGRTAIKDSKRGGLRQKQILEEGGGILKLILGALVNVGREKEREGEREKRE